jgi:hypothetical protein
MPLGRALCWVRARAAPPVSSSRRRGVLLGGVSRDQLWATRPAAGAKAAAARRRSMRLLWDAISAATRRCHLLREYLRQANASAAARKKIGCDGGKDIGCTRAYGAASRAVATAVAINEIVTADDCQGARTASPPYESVTLHSGSGRALLLLDVNALVTITEQHREHDAASYPA